EFTVTTTWLGPTAMLLSDGLRSVAVPCGPSKPSPSPSKLLINTAAARVPADVCSTAAAPAGTVMSGGTTGAGGGACPETRNDAAAMVAMATGRVEGI